MGVSLTAVTLIEAVALLLEKAVVPPELAVKSIRDLTALAREKPGQLNFGTGGSGTLGFVAAELYQTLTGVKMVHVSYKGTILAQNDLLANRVQVMFSDMPIALPQANAGKLRAIAVTSAKRSTVLPEVPAVAEPLPVAEALPEEVTEAPEVRVVLDEAVNEPEAEEEAVSLTPCSRRAAGWMPARLWRGSCARAAGRSRRWSPRPTYRGSASAVPRR